MPVLAVPGAAAAAPAAPVAARAAGPATTPPFGRAGDPVDLVSLSPAARLRQALDAPALAMRQLDALLGEFEQISVLTRGPAPLALGALATEIGAGARTLGAGVQALLPTPDAPTPLQLGAAAALRVLATLAPAQTALPDTHPQDTHPQDSPACDIRPQDARAQDTGAQDARPQDTRAQAAPARDEDAPFQDARPDARPPATTPPDLMRPDLTRPDLMPPDLTRARVAPASPGSGADAAAPLPGPRDAPARTPGDPPRPSPAPHDPAPPAPALPDPARPDPARQLLDPALVLLREAAATLGRMQLRPRAAFPAQPDRPPGHVAGAVRDEAWCDAQIATALGQVAQASRLLSGARPAGWPGLAAAFGRGPASPGGPARAARSWTWLALLCCLGVALWATRSLDFGVARVLTASGLGAGAAAWGWRRAAGRKVRIELR